jgi:hypothetical protein
MEELRFLSHYEVRCRFEEWVEKAPRPKSRGQDVLLSTLAIGAAKHGASVKGNSSGSFLMMGIWTTAKDGKTLVCTGCKRTAKQGCFCGSWTDEAPDQMQQTQALSDKPQQQQG